MAGGESVPAYLVSADGLSSLLTAVRNLRAGVRHAFSQIVSGPRPQPPAPHQVPEYLTNTQNALLLVANSIRELDVCCANLSLPPTSQPLGNAGILSQDSSTEKAQAYQSLLQTYQWVDKVREYSAQANMYLSQNSLKRSNQLSKRLRKPQQTSHNVSTQTVDVLISQLQPLFLDMQVSLSRPFGTASVLQITLGRTLRAVIVLRSLIIEWIVVKAYHENFTKSDGEMDIWSGSRYKVFQKVTGHTNAAMLNYYSPLMPELAVRSFMIWLHSYNNLFVTPCHKCNQHLMDDVPPTWRDFRTLDAYHESCKP